MSFQLAFSLFRSSHQQFVLCLCLLSTSPLPLTCLVLPFFYLNVKIYIKNRNKGVKLILVFKSISKHGWVDWNKLNEKRERGHSWMDRVREMLRAGQHGREMPRARQASITLFFICLAPFFIIPNTRTIERVSISTQTHSRESQIRIFWLCVGEHLDFVRVSRVRVCVYVCVFPPF